MVVFHHRHHRDLRRKAEEHAVVFIRFDDKSLPAAGMRVVFQVLGNAADNVAGVFAAGGEQPGQHGRGGGFAVRAGHRDAQSSLHQLAEEVGAFEHRDAGGQGSGDLGVGIGDRRGAHHQIGAADVFGRVAGENGRARCRQLLRQVREGPVRAADREPALQEEPGDGGESAATDADQVNVDH